MSPGWENFDWGRKREQVRAATREACREAENWTPRATPSTRDTSRWQGPRENEGQAGAPLSWLAPTDGPTVITQAWERLTADEYTDEQRDRENQRPTHRAPMLGADRG